MAIISGERSTPRVRMPAALSASQSTPVPQPRSRAVRTVRPVSRSHASSCSEKSSGQTFQPSSS